MRVWVVTGHQAAWGRSVAYRGPLLLAYDTRLGPFDPLAMPIVQLESPTHVQPGGQDAAVLVSFPSSLGEITFCDFASAGQPPALPARPVTTNVVWQFSRADGSVIAEQIRLANDGTLQGYAHPNEARWGFDGDTLTFFTSGGLASTRFMMRLLEHGKQVLSGRSLLDDNVRHLLSEVDRTIIGKTWQFRRDSPDKRILLSSVRLLANGGFDVPTHPNETRWGMEDSTLVFYDPRGAATTRFTSIRMRNGRVERSGTFLPDPSIRHVLSETDPDITSRLWEFKGKGGSTLADKLRLLPNQRLDGYHHDNEASWSAGNARDTLVFRSRAGVVSTSFDSFSAAGGVMRFEGWSAFDPEIRHVIEEFGPGWAMPSSYISWVPRPRLGIDEDLLDIFLAALGGAGD
jgi:hypothetical protein